MKRYAAFLRAVSPMTAKMPELSFRPLSAAGLSRGQTALATLGARPLDWAASWFLRSGDPAHAGSGPFILSLVAVLLALVTGWLGGELVDRLGVGVNSGAHLDSPSSLSHRPATDHWTPARTLQPRKA